MNNTGFTTTLYINGFKAVDNYIDNSKVMKELGEALEEGGVITLKLVTDDGNVIWKWGSRVNFTAYLCGRLPEDQDFTVTFNNIFISFGDKAEAIAVAESVFEGTGKGLLKKDDFFSFPDTSNVYKVISIFELNTGEFELTVVKKGSSDRYRSVFKSDKIIYFADRYSMSLDWLWKDSQEK